MTWKLTNATMFGFKWIVQVMQLLPTQMNLKTPLCLIFQMIVCTRNPTNVQDRAICCVFWLMCINTWMEIECGWAMGSDDHVSTVDREIIVYYCILCRWKGSWLQVTQESGQTTKKGELTRLLIAIAWEGSEGERELCVKLKREGVVNGEMSYYRSCLIHMLADDPPPKPLK